MGHREGLGQRYVHCNFLVVFGVGVLVPLIKVQKYWKPGAYLSYLEFECLGMLKKWWSLVHFQAWVPKVMECRPETERHTSCEPGDSNRGSISFPRAAGAAFEQRLSKKASKILVTHCENENSITKTNKKHSNIDFSDLPFSFSSCFHSQYVRNLALYTVFLQSVLSRDFFFTFWYPSQLKHTVLRAFLAGHLLKKLSKLGVLDERGMKKSKKHCTGVRSEQFLL